MSPLRKIRKYWGKMWVGKGINKILEMVKLLKVISVSTTQPVKGNLELLVYSRRHEETMLEQCFVSLVHGQSSTMEGGISFIPPYSTLLNPFNATQVFDTDLNNSYSCIVQKHSLSNFLPSHRINNKNMVFTTYLTLG